MQLREEISDLVSHAYRETGDLVEKEAGRSTHLYTLREEDGALVAFFWVGRTTFRNPSGETVPAVYLGLSGGRRCDRGTAPTFRLYRRLVQEVTTETPTPILFGTTASPIVFGLMRRLFFTVHPHHEKRADELREHWLGEVREFLGRDRTPADPDRPFRIPALSGATRYSDEERKRLRIGTPGDILREEWGIREENGDRLVLLLEPREE